MKNMAVVSERGTVTIPEAVRRQAHIQTGDLLEFKPGKDKIILRHLVTKSMDKEDYLIKSEWAKFDKLVAKQLKEGDYKSYKDAGQAKLHSRALMAVPTAERRKDAQS